MQEADKNAVNALRVLAMDAVLRAKEGHPGGPLGMAPMAYVLWTRIMRYDPSEPHWPNRDRFVLSAGHASMLLYGALHLSGYGVSLDDLKSFRQWGSATPGHPEYGHAPGVETTTGPLGQGFANSVGMALAGKHLAARFNRDGNDVFNYRVYGICSDGDLQEGISHEAASLAGHLGLGNLVMLYDDNNIQLDGPTAWAFSEDVSKRFEAYGWQVLEVRDGDHDLDGIEAAIRAGQQDTARPTLIRVHTTIGYGLPKQGTSEVHGKAPSADDVAAARKAYGWTNDEAFNIPDDAARPWREAGQRGAGLYSEWQAQVQHYRSSLPQEGRELDAFLNGSLPNDWTASLPSFDPAAKPVATRSASQQVLNALAGAIPQLIGGSADLSSSNNTIIKDAPAIEKGSYGGRNINYGVREHAMCAIANGLALSGLRPFVGTFLIFSDYAKNSIRLASLMHQPVTYVFTHDSIGVGTDGPTHQPVEQLAGLRAIPGMHVIRPADANETASAWRAAIERTDGPTILALTRQNVPILPPNPEGAAKGGYVIADCEGQPDVLLIASGSEVHLVVEAQAKLAEAGTRARAVSLPCWEVFAAQGQDYRDSVLPPSVRARVAVEAASGFGWERWTGLDGRVIALDRFGASAPGDVVMEKLGFTVDHVVQEAQTLLGRGGASTSTGDETPQAKPTTPGSGHS